MDRELVLEGFGVRLEPLAERHLEQLRARCGDARIWEKTYQPNPFVDAPSAQAWLERTLADPRCVPFAIVDAVSREIAGSTRYFDIEPENRKLEIGWTFIEPSRWRTALNTACKYLLLEHAFETLHLARVQFKAEAINVRSRRALERIGATHEGTLRNFRVRPDGEVRDTAFYSIVESEWPKIKARLLAYVGQSRDTRAAG